MLNPAQCRQVFVILGFLVLLVVGVFGLAQVKDGLDITDIVPRGTSEHKFLEARSKYFGFYNMYLVTQEDFDYPNNQELLYEFHEAFQPVKRIIKKEGQTLPRFWLHMFRDWLLSEYRSCRTLGRGVMCRVCSFMIEPPPHYVQLGGCFTLPCV